MATGGKELAIKDLRGSNVVIYFYPKDNTSGCTKEGCEFKAHHLKFKRRNTIVLGISRDSLASHERFREKFGTNGARLKSKGMLKKYSMS